MNSNFVQHDSRYGYQSLKDATNQLKAKITTSRVMQNLEKDKEVQNKIYETH